MMPPYIPLCIPDALDAYADQLEKILPQLPPAARNLPTIIHEAARKMRSAKSPAEANRYVLDAIAQVKKSIVLLHAVDNDARVQLGREVDNQAIGVLQNASVQLERVAGL